MNILSWKKTHHSSHENDKHWYEKRCKFHNTIQHSICSCLSRRQTNTYSISAIIFITWDQKFAEERINPTSLSEDFLITWIFENLVKGSLGRGSIFFSALQYSTDSHYPCLDVYFSQTSLQGLIWDAWVLGVGCDQSQHSIWSHRRSFDSQITGYDSKHIKRVLYLTGGNRDFTGRKVHSDLIDGSSRVSDA